MMDATQCRIYRLLEEFGPMTAGRIKQQLSGKYRPLVDTAVARLVDERVLRQEGRSYALAWAPGRLLVSVDWANTAPGLLRAERAA